MDLHFTKKGILSAPYYIFIKTGEALNDLELLNILNVSDYKSLDRVIHKIPQPECILFITKNGEWTQIMDSITYSLWYTHFRNNPLEKIAQKFEVFACSIGDIEETYDFSYYKNGQLVRRFEKDSEK